MSFRSLHAPGVSDVGDHGWCYTTPPPYKKTDWGYCSKSCTYSETDIPRLLQVVELYIVAAATCTYKVGLSWDLKGQMAMYLLQVGASADHDSEYCVAGRAVGPRTARIQ